MCYKSVMGVSKRRRGRVSPVLMFCSSAVVIHLFGTSSTPSRQIKRSFVSDGVKTGADKSGVVIGHVSEVMGGKNGLAAGARHFHPQVEGTSVGEWRSLH